MHRLGIACVAAFAVLCTTVSSWAQGPFIADSVWPLSGTAQPSAKLSSTFGPRQLVSDNYRYDFHRGIDIAAPVGTAVYAVAAGEVRLAGAYSYYSDPIVQLRHEKPDGSGYYYTNYMHLSAWSVAEGDVVTKGQKVGEVGESASGFAHLHFEVRDGGIYQKYCVHPLLILPYPDRNTPTLAVTNVDQTDPTKPQVTAVVSLNRVEIDDDLDFNRIEVQVFEKQKKNKLVLIDSHAYDMMAWNLAYTPTKGDPNVNMDNPDFNGVSASVIHFNASKELYEVTFTFTDLNGPSDPSKTIIRVTATDIQGNSAVLEYPESGGGGGGGGGNGGGKGGGNGKNK